MTQDLAARFKGTQTFVEDTQTVLLQFYDKIGQHLREWVAMPPKLAISEPSKVIDGSINEIESAVIEQIPELSQSLLAVNV